ncbi:protease inhibitor protein [Streptacidiphilus sp. 4-A2]|nr:protease inhibitor protein [Streptacidiphilus sp. 4-A2]
MRTHKALATTLATAVAATLSLWALAVPQAQAVPMLQEPDALVLTVSGPGLTASPGVEQAATLSCTPTAAGDHPDAASACSALLGVDGDIAALPAAKGICPDFYLPVTAEAIGVWNGQQVSFQQTYPNTCMMLRATGAVFNF